MRMESDFEEGNIHLQLGSVGVGVMNEVMPYASQSMPECVQE